MNSIYLEPISDDQEIFSHIIIHYWDDVFGQQVLLCVPQLDSKVIKPIKDILSRLVDIHYNYENYQFIYSDKLFASQNIKFSTFSPANRGRYQDFVISLVITPPEDKVIKKIPELWDFIPAIQEVLMPFLFAFDKDNADNVIRQMQYHLEDIIIEIDQLFLLDV